MSIGGFENISMPINITKIVDFNGESNYLVVVRVTPDTMSEESTSYLGEAIHAAISDLMKPSMIKVIITAADFDMDFYQLSPQK